MSMTLSLNRQSFYQISFIAAIILFVVNLITSAWIGYKLVKPSNIQNNSANPQQNTLQQAIDLINDQTLEN